MEYKNSKGISYYLHKAKVTLRGGKITTVYFFTRTKDCVRGTPCELPKDHYINENTRNGFMVVRENPIININFK